jgi:hypothetical protein
MQPPLEHEGHTPTGAIHEQAEEKAAPGIRRHRPSKQG